jgi:hypothetical protein
LHHIEIAQSITCKAPDPGCFIFAHHPADDSMSSRSQ